MNLEEKISNLLQNAQSYIDEIRKEILLKVVDAVGVYYKNHYNQLKDNYLDEALAVSDIISKYIGLGFSALLSVFLYRSTENTAEHNISIKELLPKELEIQVSTIIDGINKMQKFDNERIFGTTSDEYKQKEENLSKRSRKFSKSYEQYMNEQGDLFRQFLMSVSQDVRVLLIKLAYHYYKILNINRFEEKKQFILANEARYVFAPIAHQLGLYKIKSDMEEIAMQILNKDEYQYIANVLASTQQEREEYIARFIEPIKKSIDNLKINAIVKGRPKSIHSIWKKMVNQKVGIDKIYDLFAIRVIIMNENLTLQQEKELCWIVYSKITDFWRPNPNRLKDWVSVPKASGYESLHTTVIGPEGRWVEVQIRTKRMDDIAEKGDAAHWKYKEVKGQGVDEQWINAIRELLETKKELEEEDIVKKELYSETIFVYTPKGELVKLPNGATVLDFAYKLHTEIGARCTGAKISNKLVGIRHLLKNGDVVEVTTSKNQKPHEEWLEIAVTSHARNRIKRALKEMENEKIELGKQMLIDVFEKMKLKYKKVDFEVDNKVINQLRKKLNYDKINEFYLAIANEIVKIDEKYLYEQFVEPQETTYENIIKKLTEQIVTEDKKGKSDVLVIDNNVSSIKFELARCCNPIRGDKIFAYISATSGTKIHKLDCPNAHDLITRHPYRVLPARWKQGDNQERFKAKIFISCQQTPGIIAKISDQITNAAAVDLYEINIKPTSNKTYEGTVGVLVASAEVLNKLIDKLKTISGVMSVQRQEKI